MLQEMRGRANSTPSPYPRRAFLRASLNGRLHFAGSAGRLPSMEVDLKWWFVLGIVLLVALVMGISVGVVLVASRRDEERR